MNRKFHIIWEMKLQTIILFNQNVLLNKNAKLYPCLYTFSLFFFFWYMNLSLKLSKPFSSDNSLARIFFSKTFEDNSLGDKTTFIKLNNILCNWIHIILFIHDWRSTYNILTWNSKQKNCIECKGTPKYCQVFHLLAHLKMKGVRSKS